jgi:hypothetical protein
MSDANLTGHLFHYFLASKDRLRVYHRAELIFSSKDDGLAPLVDYVIKFVPEAGEVLIFDRVVGNAAALLLKLALCTEVWSSLGSERAAQTLSNFGIGYHFVSEVPYILNRQSSDICPFEKLSMGKTPDEFYETIKALHCANLGLNQGR